MKIQEVFINGAKPLPRMWKNVLVAWFVMLLLLIAAMNPLMQGLWTGFDSSLITEKLKNGIFPEAFTDMGSLYSGVIRGFGSSILLLALITFILNAFFSGGFFDAARKDAGECTVKEFMRGCVRNFWSFMLILLFSVIMILFIALLITVVPNLFINMDGDHVEKTIFRTELTAICILIVLLPVLLLVSDYSRAWKTGNPERGTFEAIANGFRLTFGKLTASWIVVFIILVVNSLFLWLTSRVLTSFVPQTGWGVFLFFLISQALFILKFFLRVYRYSCVTALLEQRE